jgi:deoxyribodipyrimidine photo-lyase
VRTLYATGYLHNHARLWLASYVVHLRKVHWRTGADWMYGYLLDGDLGSNHLSWQWVAGTGSSKPYLFNAENVARYAPAAWHVHGTSLDVSYDALDRIARDPTALCLGQMRTSTALPPPDRFPAPPADAGFTAPDGSIIAGEDVWLVHPWALDEPPQGVRPVAVFDATFHERWPWSAARWAFVTERQRALTDVRWYAPAHALRAALASARSLVGIADLHLGSAFDGMPLYPSPRYFTEPGRRLRSFSAWWHHVTPQSATTTPQSDLFA